MPSCSCRRRSLGSGMPSSIAAAAGLVMPLILPLVQQDQDNNWLTETAGQPACRSLTAGDLGLRIGQSPVEELSAHIYGAGLRSRRAQAHHASIPGQPVADEHCHVARAKVRAAAEQAGL